MNNLIKRKDVIDGIREYFRNETYPIIPITECMESLINDVIKKIPGEKTAKIKVCNNKSTLWYVCSECNRDVDKWDLYCRHWGKDKKNEDSN